MDVSGFGTREYAKGVEFTNFMLYPRSDDARVLAIPLKVMEENLDRFARRWISVYCRNFLNVRRESTYQVYIVSCAKSGGKISQKPSTLPFLTAFLNSQLLGPADAL